jgi:hypothetical protein
MAGHLNPLHAREKPKGQLARCTNSCMSPVDTGYCISVVCFGLRVGIGLDNETWSTIRETPEVQLGYCKNSCVSLDDTGGSISVLCLALRVGIGLDHRTLCTIRENPTVQLGDCTNSCVSLDDTGDCIHGFLLWSHGGHRAGQRNPVEHSNGCRRTSRWLQKRLCVPH